MIITSNYYVSEVHSKDEAGESSSSKIFLSPIRGQRIDYRKICLVLPILSCKFIQYTSEESIKKEKSELVPEKQEEQHPFVEKG